MSDHRVYRLRAQPNLVLSQALSRRVTEEAKRCVRATRPTELGDPPRAFWNRAWYLVGPMNRAVQDFIAGVWITAAQCHIAELRGDS